MKITCEHCGHTAEYDESEIHSHRLMCGNSTNVDHVAMLMGEDVADILITSPPYNVGNNAHLREHYQRGKTPLKTFYNDFDDTGNWLELIQKSTRNAQNYTTSQFINIQMLADNKVDFITWLNENKDKFVDIIVWNKHTCPPQMEENILNNAFEFVVILDNENPSRKIRFGSFRGNVSNMMETSKEKNEFSDIHKAVFSVEFVGKLLDINSLCKSVLDLFGGTGTTLMACEQTNRKCYMMELSPKYVDVIIKRWEEYTGKKAVKIA